MRRLRTILGRTSLGTFYLASLCAAAVATVNHANSVVERRSYVETLRFNEVRADGRVDGGAMRRVEIDNVYGSVKVIGEQREDVALSVHEVATADSPELLARARREARLERLADGAGVRIAARGPFRDGEGNCCCRNWERMGYRVEYAIEVRVPSDVRLVASTVDGGDVNVEGVRGDLRDENVNGSVSARGVEGGGSFGTVNGKLEVRFAANPTGPSSFSNVNGDIDVEFRPGLAADVELKTLNGGMWSDFLYTARPLLGSVERRQGHFVYTNNHTAAIRIAEGGPELRFETVNGEIRLRKHDR
jgi:hypothetical protein